MKTIILDYCLIGLIAFVIVVISPRHASAEESGCSLQDEVFRIYQPIQPPKPVLGTLFYKDGKEERTIADYRGQGVVLNFWATWCPPCIRELPSLDRLKVKLSDKGIQVLALSGDKAGAEIVDQFYRKFGISNLEIMIDPNATLRRQSDIFDIPTTMLIDTQGREIGRIVGIAEWDSAEVVDFILDCLGEGGV